MFFLPHNLCCLCRKGNNPVWSHQSVQLTKTKWKNWKWGKMCNYLILYFSLLSLILISSADYLFLQSWVFSQVNQNLKFQDNILVCKSLWLFSEDLRSSKNTTNFLVFSLHSILKVLSVISDWQEEEKHCRGNLNASLRCTILQLPLWKHKIYSNCHSSGTYYKESIGKLDFFFFPLFTICFLAGETVISGFVNVIDIHPESGAVFSPVYHPAR